MKAAIRLVVLACTALTGCATTVKFQSDLMAWVGRPIGDYVMASVLAPTQVIDDGKGGKIYVFDRHGASCAATTPAEPSDPPAPSAGATKVADADVVPVGHNCIWTFETDASGTIQRWSYRGRGCRA
jgi:hypothetical protein